MFVTTIRNEYSQMRFSCVLSQYHCCEHIFERHHLAHSHRICSRQWGIINFLVKHAHKRHLFAGDENNQLKLLINYSDEKRKSDPKIQMNYQW